MVAERGGKAAPSPVKRLFIGVKQPNPKQSSSSSPCNNHSNSNSNSNSNLDRYPLRLRTPDLSNCHVCNSRINITHKKGNDKDKFKTLDSQWRIVIICNCCYINLQSAKNCSYCFNEMNSTELYITCVTCNRRVHRDCLSMYSRLNFNCDLDSFTCIDCWVPRSINKKRIRSNVKDCDNSKALEEAVKDAKLKAEKKQADAAKSREKALEKAAAAKRATEIAADALGFDDAELALRLHRAINSSRRTFKDVGAVELGDFVNGKKWNVNACSSAGSENPDSGPSIGNEKDLEINACSLSGHQVIEADTDHLARESPDRVASEPSLQKGTLENGSSSDLGTLDHKRKRESGEASGSQGRNDETDSSMNSERVVDAGRLKLFKSEGWVLALPAQKERGSCSSMETKSSGNGSNIESVSGCHHKGVLTYKRGTRFRSSFSLDHSLMQKQSCSGPAMILKMYSRRRFGRKMYIRKYCRRRTNSKLNFDPSTNFCAETFDLKSEASGTVQVNDTEILTSSGTSSQSPCDPIQASTPAIF